MLRMIGNIFSSSQAHPAAKSESEREAEEEAQSNENLAHMSSDIMNYDGEAHLVGLSEDDDYPMTTPNAHTQEDIDKEEGGSSEQEANGATKQDSLVPQPLPEKASAKDSERPTKDIWETGDEQREIFADVTDTLPTDSGIEVPVEPTASEKGRSKQEVISKTNGSKGAKIKQRTSRRTPSHVRELGSEGENRDSSGRRTRSASRALESAGEEPTADSATASRSRKSKTTTTKRAKPTPKSRTLPEIPEDDAGDEGEVPAALPLKVSQPGKTPATTAKKTKQGSRSQLPTKIFQDGAVDENEESTGKSLPVKASRTRKPNITTASKQTPKTQPLLELSDVDSDEDETINGLVQRQVKAPSSKIQPSTLTKQAQLGAARATRARKSGVKALEPQPDESSDEFDILVPKSDETKRKSPQFNESAVEGEDNPLLPTSKKDLGKRPAEFPVPSSRKKQRKTINAKDTPPLTSFGFTNRSDGIEAEHIFSTPIQYLNGEELGATATRLLREALTEDNQADREGAASQTTPIRRYATPKFTPVNKQMQSRPQVLITSSSRPVAKEPQKADAYVSLEDSDAKSSSDEQPTEPQFLKSSERRKRRLPVDDPVAQNTPRQKTMSRTSSQTPKQARSFNEAQRVSKNGQKRLPKEHHGHLAEQVYTEIAEFRESWLSQKDITQEEFNDMIQEGARPSKAFLDALCLQIPDTPRVKLYNAMKRKYHNFGVRGVWTAEQDQELLEAYEQYGQDANKWKRIGKAINRFSEDCRDRYRNYLVCGDNQLKSFWTKEEEDSLREIVEDILENIRELKSLSIDPEEKNREDDSLIDWNVVSIRMNRTRSRLQCMVKWKNLKEREDPEGDDPAASAPIAETEWRMKEARNAARLMTPEHKLQLLHEIRDSRAARESSIPWIVIQAQTNMKGDRMTLKVCFRRLKLRVPGYETMMLQDIVGVLIAAYEEAAPNEPEAYADATNNNERKVDSEVPHGRKHAREVTSEASTSSKKRKSVHMPQNRSNFTVVKAVREGGDNGEGPSRRKLVISKAKKPGLIQKTGQAKKPKVFEQMQTSTPAKDNGREEEGPASASRNPKSKRVAKKPLVNARRSLQRTQRPPKSAERITTSDDEPEPESAEPSMPTPIQGPRVSAPATERRQVFHPTPEEAAYFRLAGNFRSLDQVYADEARAAEAHAPEALSNGALSNKGLEAAESSMDVDEPADSDDENVSSLRDCSPQQMNSPSGTPADSDIEDYHVENELTKLTHDQESSAESELEDDQEDENELTKLTHDQESVDLDQGQQEEEANVVDARDEAGASISQEESLHDDHDGMNSEEASLEEDPNGMVYEEASLQEDHNGVMDGETSLGDDHNGMSYEDGLVPENDNDLMVNGVNEPGLNHENHIDDTERGLAPNLQMPVVEQWGGYGAALQYNRGQVSNERTAANPAADPVDDSSSSNCSTIYHPRFVVSSAPAPDAKSTSDEESSEEDQEELVEPEDYEDDDYEERRPLPVTRASAVSARQESFEL